MSRALVLGYGSIGARHSRILAGMGMKVAVVSRRNAVDGSFPSVADALSSGPFDYVVVANETSGHGPALSAIRSLGHSGPVLVEKPLATAAGADLPPGDPTCFVGYNLRFHPVLQALRSALAGQHVISAEISCASWLPDWRPGRDYRTTSSAHAAAGGGVLHDLSHELDYAMWLLGPWLRVTAIGGHLSELRIETDDVRLILAQTENCPALSINLNYLDRIPRRQIVINTTRGTLRADLEAGTLHSDQAQILSCEGFSIDDTYRDQHADVLAGRLDSVCDYRQGLLVVEMMAAIERSAAEAAWLHRGPAEGGTG